jgi:hypothetical protein
MNKQRDRPISKNVATLGLLFDPRDCFHPDCRNSTVIFKTCETPWCIIITTSKKIMKPRKTVDAIVDSLPKTTNRANEVAAKMVERTRRRRTGMSVMLYDVGSLDGRTLGLMFERSAS